MESQDERAAVSSLWRNRNYMLLWSGQAISSIGTSVARLALPLLVLSLTRSPAEAGFVQGVATIPYLLLSLLAGALADRWNRRRVMILCDSGRTLAAASIPIAWWTGHLSLVQIYAVALIEGTLYVFFDLAETAALPRIVGRDQLPNALAQNGATFSASQLLGQPLGGLLYQIGHTVPFLADAISFAASVFSLLFLRGNLQGERAAVPNLWAEIRNGLLWLWREPLVRLLAFIATGLWLTLAGNTLLVIVIARHMHAGAATIGLIFAVNGVGGVVGSVAGGWLQRRVGFAPVIIASVWLWAVLWPLYALAPNVIVLGAITGSIFLVFPIYNVVQMSYRMQRIPDELQGRVNSVFRLIAFAGQPAGMALMGGLLQTLGITTTVLIGAAWLTLLAAFVTASPAIRTGDRHAQRQVDRDVEVQEDAG